jgi:hypothetical protein
MPQAAVLLGLQLATEVGHSVRVLTSFSAGTLARVSDETPWHMFGFSDGVAEANANLVTNFKPGDL